MTEEEGERKEGRKCPPPLQFSVYLLLLPEYISLLFFFCGGGGVCVCMGEIKGAQKDWAKVIFYFIFQKKPSWHCLRSRKALLPLMQKVGNFFCSMPPSTPFIKDLLLKNRQGFWQGSKNPKFKQCSVLLLVHRLFLALPRSNCHVQEKKNSGASWKATPARVKRSRHGNPVARRLVPSLVKR